MAAHPRRAVAAPVAAVLAAVLGALLATLEGCTSFVPVRSAEVVPGRRLDVGATLATPPGDAAAWFWAYDCDYRCDRWVPSVDVGFTKGVVPDAGGRPYEWGAGLAGFYPYAHGYVQLRPGPRPFGIGTRAAISFAGWYELSLHARQDVPLGRRTRLLLVPAGFLHGGNSPNGRNPGTFAAVAQGIGLERDAGRSSVTPSVLFVLGRVDRSSYGQRTTDVTGFLVMSLSVRR